MKFMWRSVAKCQTGDTLNAGEYLCGAELFIIQQQVLTEVSDSMICGPVDRWSEVTVVVTALKRWGKSKRPRPSKNWEVELLYGAEHKSICYHACR